MKLVSIAVSILFHPLFVLTYSLLILLSVAPHSFGVVTVQEKVPLILTTVFLTVFFPAISIFLMKSLGFIDSLQLRLREERIGPLIVAIVCYTWLFINIYSNTDIPVSFTLVTLGSTISLGLTFLATVFDKISLHTVGTGGLTSYVALLVFSFDYEWINFGAVTVQLFLFLLLILVLAGLVGTARLQLQAHNSRQVFGGFLVGLIGQMIAWRFLL